MVSKYPSAIPLALAGFLLLQFQLATSVSTANLTTLRVTQVIFRHGARSIDKTYPLDPYRNESYWYPGLSQLNNIGKFQGFNLGTYLRERYSGFINETYNLKDVYVQSSGLTRTMETAYSVMAGFYLPNDLPKDLNTTYESLFKRHVEIPLPWKSVPVHTVQPEIDNIMAIGVCPRYTQLLTELQTEEKESATEEEKRFYTYVSENTGLSITNAIDYHLAMDSIHIEKYFNFTLPSWTVPVLNSSIPKNTYFTQLSKTYEQKRLRAGPLLERLLQNMLPNETIYESDFQRGRRGLKKMYFFSGHDETIAGLLNTLGMFDSKRPDYTSALLVELHQNISSKDLNETDHEPYKLEIPNCTQSCSLFDFRTLAQPYIPLDWREECKISGSSVSFSISGATMTLIIVGGWVIIFIVLHFWGRSGRNCRSNEKQRKDSYTRLLQ